MSRTGSSRDLPHPKPVEKIELSEKHLGWRIAFFILFVIIAVTAFSAGVSALFSSEPGWQEIEVDSNAETNCGNEFVFMYYLGADGKDATVENKALKIIYTDACEMAHKLFHNNELFEGINNIEYINQHPNEEIEVDEALYRAFSVNESYNSRALYLAPIYVQYDDIFYCQDDSEIVSFDPYLNEEMATHYKEIASYAQNPDEVRVELLGNNKIRLYVSEEYLKYAKENFITDFIDFSWMKNAFIADYLADTLITKGYTKGSISSYDGFVRNMDASDTSYSFNIYDSMDQTVYQAAVMEYSGSKSIVYLRDYIMNSMDKLHYYTLDNGEIRTMYLDTKDGLCKNSIDSLYFYSEKQGCAEVLLQMIPVYISDDFSKETLSVLRESEVYSIYCEDNVIYYNDSDLNLTQVLSRDDVKYTTQLVK